MAIRHDKPLPLRALLVDDWEHGGLPPWEVAGRPGVLPWYAYRSLMRQYRSRDHIKEPEE